MHISWASPHHLDSAAIVAVFNLKSVFADAFYFVTTLVLCDDKVVVVADCLSVYWSIRV